MRMKKFLVKFLSIIVMVGISFGAVIISNKYFDFDSETTVENGLSAYELAVQYGYGGTVQEWLNSLNGKTAYEIAKENGYTGSETEWTASLKATAGKDGVGIKTAAFSENNELLITLTDDTVLNLGVAKGADGENGENGNDGVGITAATINEDGQLVLSFSDNTTVNLDKVVGMNGANGIGIASSVINDKGELIITYTNDQTANLGVVIGAKGDKGDQGEQGLKGDKGDKGNTGDTGSQGEKGDDGISITKTEINDSGELIITLSDDTVSNLGVVVGAKGDDGKNGENGDAGISVTGAEINTSGELVLTFSNSQISNLGNVIGAKGEKGDAGEQGLKGDKGDQGLKGDKGDDGISVVKTEINTKGELIITLSDDTVSNLGVVVGVKGDKGDTGETGAKGDAGVDGTDGVGIETIVIEEGNLKITLTNKTTLDLGNIKGEKGDKGDKGEAGNGIEFTSINEHGELIIAYTNGDKLNLGNVIGAKGDKGDTGAAGATGDKGDKGDAGADGIGVASIDTNENGELVITYTDGETVNLGKIIGPEGAKGDKGDTGVTGAQGETGAKGDKGEEGVGVSNVTLQNGELVVTLSDGNKFNLGNVKGEKGDKGDDGVSVTAVNLTEDGELSMTFSNSSTISLGNIKGQNGKDGVGISSSVINDKGELVITYSNGYINNLGSVKGPKGDDGKSAYELYCEAYPEYIGSEAQWLDDLVNGRLSNKSTYTVTFDTSNVTEYLPTGTTAPEVLVVESGKKAADPQLTPNLLGYEIAWYYENTDFEWVFLGYSVTEDLTLTAKLEVKEEMKQFVFTSTADTCVITGSHTKELSRPYIPEYVTSISNYAFDACVFGEIIIAEGVTSIGTRCFGNNSILKSVTIPRSVKSIGNGIFLYCNSSTITINYNGTQAEWNAISKTDSWDAYYSGTIYVVCTDGTITC